MEPTMVTFGYAALWFIGTLFAFLLGLASHYWHAYLQAYPDKLVDGYRWRDHAFNALFSQNYVWYGHYDENGWWEYYSLRNLTIHTAIPTLLAATYGAYCWSDRASVVAEACKGFGRFGLVPIFCG
jgi:hypothetical protein